MARGTTRMQSYRLPYISPAKSMTLCSKLVHDTRGVADLELLLDLEVVVLEPVVDHSLRCSEGVSHKSQRIRYMDYSGLCL